MLCSKCGRLPGPICSLCRSVERIRVLAASEGCTAPTSWGSTLRVLRETCGILSDINEENSGWSLGPSGGVVQSRSTKEVHPSPRLHHQPTGGIARLKRRIPPKLTVETRRRRRIRRGREGRSVRLKHVIPRALLLLNRSLQRGQERTSQRNLANRSR